MGRECIQRWERYTTRGKYRKVRFRQGGGRARDVGFGTDAKVCAYTYLAGAGLSLFFLHRLPGNLTGGTRFFSIYILCNSFSLEVYLFGRFLLLSYLSFQSFVSLPYLTFLACLLGSELS